MTEILPYSGPELRHRPRSPADEYSFINFGGPTTRERSVIVVGAAPTLVLQNNPNRVAWWITNAGGQTVTIDWTPEIVNGIGVLIGGGGGSLSQLVRDDGTAVGDPVYGIVVAGNTTLFLYEVRLLKLLKRA